jgi:predicted ATPase
MSLRLKIENYKSILGVELDLRPGLTILVGPNGSGKTCILSALQFLRDVFRSGAAQALARQGGARRVYHHGKSHLNFSFAQPYGERTYRRRKILCTFSWQMTISQAGPDQIATIMTEKIEITGIHGRNKVILFTLEIDRSGRNPKIKTYLCQPNEFGHDLFSIWGTEYGPKNKSFIAENFKQKGLMHAIESLKNTPDRSFFPIVAPLDQKLTEIYSSFIFLNEYNILPDVARSSTEQLPFAQMSPNGKGVSEVIEALTNRRYHKLAQLGFMDFEDTPGFGPYYFRYPAYRQYMHMPYRIPRLSQKQHEPYSDALDNINRQLAAAVRPITGVSVKIDPTSGKRFVVFEAGSEELFYPEEVSDGTVKWLCILVSLFVPFSSVYLIEEPENFLHPWMQQRLIEIMREQSKQNDTIFFLSSHSATILNASLPDEVLVVHQTNSGTTLKSMDSIEDIRIVLAESDFHLGDLWVSGAIGGVPSHE